VTPDEASTEPWRADFTALMISLQLSTATVLVLLALATPLAWWLAKSQTRLRVVVEAIVALPLVLPPTVLGFYLLLFLGPHGPMGQLLNFLGAERLVFSFGALLVGSVLYSLPFVVQPLQNAFQAIGPRLFEAAAMLRASPWDRFVTIALPLARRGFLTATVLGFAHTMGEFGVVLMLGGNIPGSTQTASIAIFNHVEALDYPAAHRLSATLLVLSFVMLLTVYIVNHRAQRVEVA
jgi:molybdate transport system permease protein